MSNREKQPSSPGEQESDELEEQIERHSHGRGDESARATRRDVLAVAAGVAAAGAAGYYTGTATASHGTTPSGEVGSASEPFLRVHTDRLVLHERTTDPSSPADGELWYNSSA